MPYIGLIQIKSAQRNSYEHGFTPQKNQRMKSMKVLLPLVIAAALGTVAAPAAHADTNDNWVVRFGVHDVVPQNNTGKLAGIESSTSSSARPTGSIEYMFTPNLGVDLLVAWPFKHDVKLDGVGTVARTMELPPTIGVNYHFMPNSNWSPFVGLGLNYTNFYNTKGAGALYGNSVSIDNSFGVAARVGFDMKINEKWLATADVRWVNIESDVKLNGEKIGTAKINPIVFGVSLGYRF
jgi:outer membrane protein